MSNDRYEKIREALAMEPTLESWAQNIELVVCANGASDS